jgi:hypothetical protein
LTVVWTDLESVQAQKVFQPHGTPPFSTASTNNTKAGVRPDDTNSWRKTYLGGLKAYLRRSRTIPLAILLVDITYKCIQLTWSMHVRSGICFKHVHKFQTSTTKS